MRKRSSTKGDAPAPSRQAIPQLLTELEEVMKRVGVRLTYEAIGGELGSGGLCKVKGQWRAIFDKRTTPAERVALLLPLVARFPLDNIEMSESARELVARLQENAASGKKTQSADAGLHAAS